MNFLESVPAIRRLDTNRTDLFAIDIVGRVSSADAENLYGLLEAAYTLHPKVDMLVRLVEADGVDWDQISPETLAQAKVHAGGHIGRCAIIGEVKVPLLGGPSLPDGIEVRHFTADDEPVA